MKEYRASTTILASPERIWAILTDGTAYPEGEPNTVRIEGRIAPGEKLTAFSTLSPGRAFPVRVTEFVPAQRMTWTDGMPYINLATGFSYGALRLSTQGTVYRTTSWCACTVDQCGL